MTRVLVLRTDGSYDERTLRGYKQFNGEVGGYMELIACGRAREDIGYVNEEGALRGLPINPWSPLLAQMGYTAAAGIGLRGNVVLCSSTEDDGEDRDVTPQVEATVNAYQDAQDKRAFLVQMMRERKWRV